MAPRGHHLTEVALLASASGDLAAAGAGEREGGLDDPAVLASLGPRSCALAVASAARSALVIVPVTRGGGGGGGVTVKPALGPDEGRISAVEWVPLAGEDGAEGEEGVAVAVGTDAGWLMFYSLAGDLLHKQVADMIHPAVSL
uniref:Rab3-GAP regulatory subunit N-terminal domain-containing protein n=1 Tax=Arundo donax TaxID=35708 RepID=A0A0A9HAR0_ARUDO